MTRYWPEKEIKRRVHFFNTFIQESETVFSNYEVKGGSYHDQSDDSEDDDDETENVGEGDPFSDSDSHDDVFVWIRLGRVTMYLIYMHIGSNFLINISRLHIPSYILVSYWDYVFQFIFL